MDNVLMTGARGKGELYISKLETNTWNPESFPEGWKKVEA